MAELLVKVFLHFSRSVKSAKEIRGVNIQPFWLIKVLLHGKKRTFSCNDQWPMREIPRVFILPTQVAIHNTGFALSCMAFLKRQSNVTHQLCSQSLYFSHPLLLQEMGSKKDLFNEVFEVDVLECFCKEAKKCTMCVPCCQQDVWWKERGNYSSVFSLHKLSRWLIFSSGLVFTNCFPKFILMSYLPPA